MKTPNAAPKGASRLVWLSTVALAVFGVSAPQSVAQQTGDRQSLNVQNADIRAFIQDVSRATGRTFVIDPRVQGSVTIASGAPLAPDQMYEVFLATMRANGYVVLPTSSGAYRVAPDEDAARQPSGQGGEKFVTQVIRLKTRDAAAVLPSLQPLVGRGGQVSAAPRSNAIVITDFADNVIRLSALARDLDRDTDTIDIVTLKNSRASTIAAALREVVGTGDAQAWQSATFTAVEASNSLIIRGPTETVSKLRDVAAKLDEGASPNGETRVIFLEHTDAGAMVELVQTLVGQSVTESATGSTGPIGTAAGASTGMSTSPSTGSSLSSARSSSYSGGGFGGTQRATVARFENANAIVVRGDPAVQQEVEAVVRQLDRRTEQVLVQAIVVEISDGAARDLGVQWLLSGNGENTIPFFATNYSNSSPSILAVAGALIGGSSLPEDSSLLDDLRDVALTSLLNTTGGLGGFASNLGGEGTFGAILNMLQRDTGSNLLSTPSIHTLNNHEATFLVGQEVPVTTGEVLSSDNNNPFRTVDRQDVGVKMRVRPQINADGSITMDIRQEVSSIANLTVSSEFVFNKRELETRVLVDDGEIVVLGGLLDQGERRTREKVPLLGDIPFLGQLFRSDSRERFETNLMIFLRPVVVRDTAAARAVTHPSLNRIVEMQRASDRDGRSMLEDTIQQFPTVTSDRIQEIPAP
jgi:general secretion pathway protein D